MKMTNNLCTQRRYDSEGGCQGSEDKTATPLQPLDRMKKEREKWVAGCLREGGSSTWGQNGRHKPPSSSSQKQGDTGATVPIEVFVSQALSCFSSANRGYNEGGMLPSPRAKGCQYWTYQTLNGWISLPMKIKSMTCFPLALLLVKWVTAIISISKTERERESVFSHVAEGTSPQTRHPHIKCINSFVVSSP